MKKFVVLALSAAVLLTGCEAYNNTNKAQRGAVVGAAGGALLGAILGNNVGNGQNSELGAVLGTVVGGAAGAVIGHQMDKQAKKIEEEIPGADVKRVDDGIVVTFDEKVFKNWEIDNAFSSTNSSKYLKKRSKRVEIYYSYNRNTIQVMEYDTLSPYSRLCIYDLATKKRNFSCQYITGVPYGISRYYDKDGNLIDVNSNQVQAWEKPEEVAKIPKAIIPRSELDLTFEPTFPTKRFLEMRVWGYSGLTFEEAFSRKYLPESDNRVLYSCMKYFLLKNIKSNYIDIIITEDNYDNVIGLAHYSLD